MSNLNLNMAHNVDSFSALLGIRAASKRRHNKPTRALIHLCGVRPFVAAISVRFTYFVLTAAVRLGGVPINMKVYTIINTNMFLTIYRSTIKFDLLRRGECILEITINNTNNVINNNNIAFSETVAARVVENALKLIHIDSGQHCKRY